MDKELFDQLNQSMREAVAIAKGEMQPSPCIHGGGTGRGGGSGEDRTFSIRFRSYDQSEGKTVQNWEQHGAIPPERRRHY